MKMYKPYECGGQLSRDFTLEKYSELITVLKGNYRIMTVADYLTLPKDDDFIAVLRHDEFPERADGGTVNN